MSKVLLASVPDGVAVIQRLLAQDHEVTIATTFSEAVAKLKEEDFDLFVTGIPFDESKILLDVAPIISALKIYELSRERRCSKANAEALFTNKESEVLERMAKGMTNGQISRELLVTVPTVKSHVREILNKLNVHNRTQASCEAIRRGLV